MKAILFDFGGTLDTGGVHWSEKFWEAYDKHKVHFSKRTYEEAYCFAEKGMPFLITPRDSLKTVLTMQVLMQATYLKRNGDLSEEEEKKLCMEVINCCYNDVLKIISENAALLKQLGKKYQLGVVSNFYGNLEFILGELKIKDLFAVIIDSASVGIEKPDPEIFRFAAGKLGVVPEEILVVGDSYDRDIQPAKAIGCSTMWLDGKSWKKPDETSSADYIIKSLYEVLVYT